jgi:hypothetical protein
MYALYFSVILQHRSFPYLHSVTLSLGLYFCGSSSVSHSYHVSTIGHDAAAAVYCSAVHSPATTLRLRTAQQAGALSAAMH